MVRGHIADCAACTAVHGFSIDEFSCEGCGVCVTACPGTAISLLDDVAGEVKLYRNPAVFATAELKMGRGNSGKLVSEVKLALTNAARVEELAIIDGSPGIGCPVIASMGEHIGTVLGGQILNSPPNEAAIRKVAGEINTDANGLWNAAQSIDVVSEKNIEAAAEVLYIVVNALAQSGFTKIETDMLSSNLARNFIQLSETINILAENSQDIVNHQSELVSEIQQIEQHISEITGVLKSVNKIADQTKILGINASIEAAHLGTSGKGFAVVAEEIRKLSESTKQTVGKVGIINETVERSITSTMNSANSTLDITSNQSASMEELSATVQSSVNLAERLRVLFDETVKK